MLPLSELTIQYPHSPESLRLFRSEVLVRKLLFHLRSTLRSLPWCIMLRWGRQAINIHPKKKRCNNPKHISARCTLSRKIQETPTPLKDTSSIVSTLGFEAPTLVTMPRQCCFNPVDTLNLIISNPTSDHGHGTHTDVLIILLFRSLRVHQPSMGPNSRTVIPNSLLNAHTDCRWALHSKGDFLTMTWLLRWETGPGSTIFL